MLFLLHKNYILNLDCFALVQQGPKKLYKRFKPGEWPTFVWWLTTVLTAIVEFIHHWKIYPNCKQFNDYLKLMKLSSGIHKHFKCTCMQIDCQKVYVYDAANASNIWGHLALLHSNSSCCNEYDSYIL